MIAQIANNNTEDAEIPVLWYRGHHNTSHSLVPSIWRDKTRTVHGINAGDYSTMHYAEDIRTQHYIAKNYHFLKKEPSSRVEWLEVMQHHGVKTRVLDWSESSIHSLVFALEPFLDHIKYREDTRMKMSPCVWILEPGKLNKKIFNYLNNDTVLKDKIFKEFTTSEKQNIYDKLNEYSHFDVYMETKETKHLDYTVNLSSINDEILRDKARLKSLLMNGDVMNPYYFMLFRIYSDGMILDKVKLPPLAVVHPYHSERIKSQKGVFTVFPFYDETNQKFQQIKVNYNAMEYNAFAKDCLHKIIISNPQKVTRELLLNGINISWLYPEMPIVSNEIEFHRVF